MVSFVVHQEATNTDTFLTFIDEVHTSSPTSRVCLVLDNLPVHNARRVKDELR